MLMVARCQAKNRNSSKVCPFSSGKTFQRWGRVSKPVKDNRYRTILVYRYRGCHCHRTRLIYLAIALPVYPVVYTYVALFPESSLASHTQPNPLIPDPITLKGAPET